MSIIFTLLSTTSIFSANLKATIYSYPASTIPTIDGILSAGEWSSAGTPVQIHLFNLSNQFKPTLLIYMMSLYSEEDILYLGLSIPDLVVNSNDHLIIVLNTSLTPLVLNPATTSVSFDDDHDAKVVWVQNNVYSDEFTDGIGFRTNNDISVGGTNDGNGKCKANGTYINFEITFPFNSGDATGKDPSLLVGSEIDIFIFYREGETGTDYSHWREEDNDYDYNLIHIGASVGMGIRFWNIFPSIAGIFISIVVIRKKK